MRGICVEKIQRVVDDNTFALWPANTAPIYVQWRKTQKKNWAKNAIWEREQLCHHDANNVWRRKKIWKNIIWKKSSEACDAANYRAALKTMLIYEVPAAKMKPW